VGAKAAVVVIDSRKKAVENFMMMVMMAVKHPIMFTAESVVDGL